MYKVFKYFLAGVFLVVGLILSSPVLAEEAPLTISVTSETATPSAVLTDVAVDVTGTVAPSASEVVASTETVKIPGTWGLFWRNIRERISLAVTFDPVKKAEKMMTFAEERLRLAEKMTEKAGDDQALQERATQMMEKADEFMQKIEEKKEAMLQKVDERTQKILERAGEHTLRREELIGKLEARLAPENLEKLQEMRQAGLENSQRLLNAINNENISEEVRNHLEEVKQRIDDHLLEVKTFLTEKKELLQKVQSGDESAKAELEQLREERMDTKEENRIMLQEKVEVRQEVRQEVGSVGTDASNTVSNDDIENEDDASQAGRVQKGN